MVACDNIIDWRILMTDNQITEETLRYLSDTSYNYAILIDGEWGCGKPFLFKRF